MKAIFVERLQFREFKKRLRSLGLMRKLKYDSKYKEINLEEGMPTVDEAMSYLKMSITLCKQNKIACLAVIHGYGSSGKGGAIRTKARQWLNAQVRNGTIKAVINGEDFDIFNFKALELKDKHSELKKLLKVCNHGMTVVEI